MAAKTEDARKQILQMTDTLRGQLTCAVCDRQEECEAAGVRAFAPGCVHYKGAKSTGAPPIRRAAAPQKPTPPAPHTRMQEVVSNLHKNLDDVMSSFFDDDVPDLTDGVYDEDEDLPKE